MDYEKKYNEALEIARQIHNGNPSSGTAIVVCEQIFPELRESENEKIRKEIIDFLETIPISELKRVPRPICKWFFWLEKQKEQPISAEEVLARAGLKPYKDGNQWCILAGDNIMEGICGFGDTIEDALYELLKKVLDLQKEQKPAKWSEEDKDYYDTIVRKLEVIGDDSGLSNNQIKFLREHCPLHCLEWSEEDETIIEGACNVLEIYGHTKLASRLKSLRPQPQGIYQQVVKGLRDMCNRYEQNGMFTDGRARDFLDNVRVKCKDAIECAPILDASSWKPSEEQMKALEQAKISAVAGNYITKDGLCSLYEDLKKL